MSEPVNKCKKNLILSKNIFQNFSLNLLIFAFPLKEDILGNSISSQKAL